MSRPVKEKKGNATKATSPAPAPPVNVASWKVPTPPPGLSTASERLWASLWEVGRDAYHPETDYQVLARYVQLLETVRELRAVIAQEGWTVTGSVGTEVTHPVVRVWLSTIKEVRALENTLGLNPESRIRLGTAAVEHRSALDEFLG